MTGLLPLSMFLARASALLFFMYNVFQKNTAFDTGHPNVGIQSDKVPLVEFTGYFIISQAFQYSYSLQHFQYDRHCFTKANCLSPRSRYSFGCSLFQDRDCVLPKMQI